MNGLELRFLMISNMFSKVREPDWDMSDKIYGEHLMNQRDAPDVLHGSAVWILSNDFYVQTSIVVISV